MENRNGNGKELIITRIFDALMEVTVMFEDFNENKTKMTVKHAGLPAGKMSELTEIGWNESFDKLAQSLL